MTMLSVRRAVITDLSQLMRICYGDSVIHADRITADENVMRYFVAEADAEIVGFAVLILREPPAWTDASDRFPNITDLYVTQTHRNKGVGSALIEKLCDVIRATGALEIYLSVEPESNANAMRLYQRKGFVALQAEPYENRWQFIDSTGKIHAGVEWLVDMRCELRNHDKNQV
jgi:GNAT superfamily N-acetyltransferase